VREYLAKRPLPFPVLVDGSREVSKAYGVWHRIGIDAWNIARPALFLVARDRSIARTFVARKQTEFPGHREVLTWIEALGAGR
jgi:peroxiredoxin